MSLRPPRSKLKTYFAALFVSVDIASLAFVGFSFWKSWEANLDKVEGRAAYSAQIVSSLVDSNLVSALKLLAVTKQLLVPVNFDRTNDDEVHKILKSAATNFSYAQEDEAFGLLFFADASGRILAQNIVGPLPNVNIKDRLYFEQAKKPGARYAIGDMVVARLTGDLVFHIAMPVYEKQGRFKGEVVQQINVKRLRNLLEDSRLISVERLSIFLPNGRVVFEHPYAVAGTNASDSLKGIYESTRDQVSKSTTLETGGLNGCVSGIAKNSQFGLTVIAATSIKSILLKTFKDEESLLFALPLFLIIWAWLIRALYCKSVDADEFESESGHDPLTGLYNRRGFEDQAKILVRDAIRNNESMGILFVDIDRFKRLNDTYGHPNGDCALCALADVLRNAACRPLDLTSRWGGEEFLILLPNTQSNGALEVANRILKDTRGLNIKTPAGAELTFTVSIGVITSHVTSYEQLESLVAQADRAMLTAKTNGRDRVSIASGKR